MSSGMAFTSGPVSFLHSRGAVTWPESTWSCSKHCLCTRNGNTAVGWPSGVECWCYLSVFVSALSMSWMFSLFFLWPVFGLLLFWLFHPKAGAAHGLPVVELATSFTPSLICWTRWLSSQVVKISTISTPFILSLIALCRGLSCVWAMLQSIDCCNLTAPDIL